MTYYTNKRWNYTLEHWNKVKNHFMYEDIKDKFILNTEFDQKGDVLIKADLYSLLKNNNSNYTTNNEFINNTNIILNNLLLKSPNNYKGNYNIGDFNIEVNNLVDINPKHLDSKQYQLLLDINKFKFI